MNRSRTPPRLALGLLLVLLPRVALATMISVRDAPCPIGDGMVKIYTQMAANTFGGFDSDLASYSTKGQFREYAVSTCPDNLFSLYGKDMELTLDAGTRARLEAALAEERARLSDPEAPPVWERYAIAARMYRELGRDPFFVAQVYVEASWTARDQAVGVYQGLNGPLHAQNLLREGALELDKDLTTEQRKAVLYNLARVAARGGYPVLRDRYLDAFEKAGPLSPEEQAALSRFRRMTHEIEPRYQDLAIASFQEGLRREGLAMQDKVQATYMLADLLRRRGKSAEALGLFTLVLSEEAAPTEIREMALVLARELAGDEPLPMDYLAPR